MRPELTNPRSCISTLVIALFATAVLLGSRVAVLSGSPAAVTGRIAFIRNGNLWIHNLANNDDTQLSSDGDDRWPAWAPSGNWIAFLRSDGGVWLIGSDGDGLERVAQLGGPRRFAWSPVADDLAFIDSGGNLDVQTANSGSPETAYAATPADRFQGVQEMAWSPDGQWIAFDHFDVGANSEAQSGMSIWRARPDGSDLSEVFDTDSPTAWVTLDGRTNDGSGILYWPHFASASISTDSNGLALVSAGGGQPQTLASELLAHHDFVADDPSDSGRVAVVEGTGRDVTTGKSLHIVDPATGIDTALTGSDTSISSPAWSPDGRYLAFVSMPQTDSGGDEPILQAIMGRHLMLLDTTANAAPQSLTYDSTYRDESPRWSPDGSSLLFVRVDAQQQVSLWAVPATVGAPQRLLNGLSTGGSMSETVVGLYGAVHWGVLFDWWPGPGP